MQKSVAFKPSDAEAVKSQSVDSLQPWQLFTLAGLIGATIVVVLARGQSAAGVILLSLLVFAAAAIGSAALRAFLPLTRRFSADEPQILGGRTRAALEREKTLVLRSIKELEFDRAMRKVSEKDFAEMSGRLRARAARLMRQLDAGSMYRDEIEKEIETRLGGSASPGSGARTDAPHTDGVGRVPGAEKVAASGPASIVCRSCKTQNDPDSRFCKGCGVRLEVSQ
jgi:hypothetical protein